MTDKVIGRIGADCPWGLSTEVQSFNEYLGQNAVNALNDMHVQVWTAKDIKELAELTAILNGLQTKLLISLATAEALKTELQRAT